LRRPPVAPRSLAHSRIGALSYGSDGRGPHRFGDRLAPISAELLTALLRNRSAAFVRVLIIAGSFSASAANKCRMNGSTSGPKLSDHKGHADEVNIADELSSFATATERRCLRASLVLRQAEGDAQEPAEGSPSSAGSCVPAIGYPLPRPRCVGGGRKARIKETLARPVPFRRRCRGSPKGIQCIRDATLMFNANAEPKRALDLGKIRGIAAILDFSAICEPGL
jgi:hypothetical protein